MCVCFFFKQRPAYELRISDWVQTCALPTCDGPYQTTLTTTRRFRYDGVTMRREVRGAGSWEGRGACYKAGVAVGAPFWRQHAVQIGRASCRESVCQYV